MSKRRGRRPAFTDDQVIEYRRQYNSMIATNARPPLFINMIARRHGVTYQAAYSMLTGNAYKRIK